MTPDIIDLLQHLAERFGVTVDYLWPLLVNYTRWLNIAWTAFDVIVAIALVIGIIYGTKLTIRQTYLYNHRDDPEFTEYSLHGGTATIAGIVTGIAVIICLFVIGNIPPHIAGIAVPEAQAIYDLLAQIKGK